MLFLPLAVSLIWIMAVAVLTHLKIVEIVADDANIPFTIGSYILAFTIYFYALMILLALRWLQVQWQLPVRSTNWIMVAELLVFVLFSIFSGERLGPLFSDLRDLLLIPGVFAQACILDTGIIREGVIPDTRPLSALIAALQDPDPELRYKAVKAIDARRDPAAVDALIAALKDEDFYVPGGAVAALGSINDPRVITALVEAWKQGDGDMKKDVENAMWHIEVPLAVEQLVDLLDDRDAAALHGAAAKALGNIGDPRAVDPLIRALSEPSCDEHMVEALAKLGDSRAVEPLLVLLQKNRKGKSYGGEKLLHASISALGYLKDSRAVEYLVPQLKYGDWYVKGIAARALGKIGDAAAVPPLIAGLSDKESSVQGDAAIALGKIKDDRAISPLADILRKSENSDLKEVAAWALGEIKNPRAIAPLAAALQEDRAIEVRKRAAYGLGKCNGSEAIPPLIASLKDEAPSVRRASAHSLGSFPQPAVIESLIAAQADKDRSVRWEATLSLNRARDEMAAAAVEKFIGKYNLPRIAKNYEKIIRKGDVSKEYQLIFALLRHGNEQMAKDFVSSEHGRLEAEGQKWLESNGLRQDSKPRPGAPEWGKKPDRV